MTGPGTRPLRLLCVSTTLDEGGAQRFTSTLLAHLDRSRFRPELALLRDAIAYPLPDDVPVTAFDYRRPWHLPRTVHSLRRLIEERRPDVVLSNVAATNIVTGLALRGIERRPVWVARIGSNPDRGDGWLRTMLLKRLYPMADRIVVNARRMLPAVERRYPSVVGRVIAVPNPVDCERVEESARTAAPHVEPVSLVAVGRLCTAKRYDVMLNAVAIVRRTHSVELDILGDGPERHRLERRTKRLGLADVVRFRGHVANPHEVAAGAGLFLSSSDYEGLPNALLEAQALGVPAVSTRCDFGPDEIVVDGETGVLVPVRDPVAMADAIRTLLDDPERRLEMGRAAGARVRECFDVSHIVPVWEETIASVVEDRDRAKSNPMRAVEVDCSTRVEP